MILLGMLFDFAWIVRSGSEVSILLGGCLILLGVCSILLGVLLDVARVLVQFRLGC